MSKKNQKQGKAQDTAELERARNDDGTYIGDDLSTPDVNEAYAQPVDAAPSTTEAVEAAAPEGVETTEQAQEPDADAAPGATEAVEAVEAIHVVVWHIKAGGRVYAPGEDAPALSEEDVARMLKSGAIALKA